MAASCSTQVFSDELGALPAAELGRRLGETSRSLLA
jgi:hypothetical protein